MIFLWESGRADPPKGRQEMKEYTIEKTGLDGWMSYRYQYQVGNHYYFGYSETEVEALETIRKAVA
jgi:hypothetical protein